VGLTTLCRASHTDPTRIGVKPWGVDGVLRGGGFCIGSNTSRTGSPGIARMPVLRCRQDRRRQGACRWQRQQLPPRAPGKGNHHHALVASKRGIVSQIVTAAHGSGTTS
jgi:hypothetical protein